MKCFVLAGGSGDRLWPLSRKNYPKQFMEIHENRSMFQETIARNLPFCDEFYIITNENYRYIVESQLQVFQGLKYRIFLEQKSHGTAPPVAVACLCCNPSEQILVVSTDHIIEGGRYKDAIIQARRWLEEGNIAILGVRAAEAHVGYGYMKCKNDTVVEFKGHVTEIMAKYFVEQGDYYWDCGIMAMKAGDYLHEMKRYVPDLLEKCINVRKELNVSGRVISLEESFMEEITSTSIGHAVNEHSDIIRMVGADIYWNRILDLESLARYQNRQSSDQYIAENCSDVTVLNYAPKKMVVVNGLKDVIVVNTSDATFISDKESVSDIKKIMKQHYKEAKEVFDESSIFYESWGIKEVLSESSGYKVKKITLYPGKSLSFHKHQQRSEHWSVVKGVASIRLEEAEKEYQCNESVFVPIGMRHQIANKTTADLVVIETSVGEHLGNKDFFATAQKADRVKEEEEIIKLEPAFKDYLWGGTRLRDDYGKRCDYEIIAESWELSTHSAGQSIIAEGAYKGNLLGEYLDMIGKEKLGWKCQPFDKFPLLIKFIDARKTLSIQVHPDDEYALPVENEYGKNEMWYICDSAPGSYIYLGFNRKISKADIMRRIHDHALEEVLNKIPVKKGQVVFVEAGTVHAIGPGLLICEIQQNSNATYRLYDYGRKDRYGDLRELHVEKALDVLKNQQGGRDPYFGGTVQEENGYTVQLLGQCKYFSTYRYLVAVEMSILVEQSSFVSVIILSGQGKIRVNDTEHLFAKGDSFFVSAGKKSIDVSGGCELLVTHV